MATSGSGNKLSDRPLLPLIFSMALPAMFSMLIQALYNVVDSIFVARFSEDALTAVSLAYPVQMLMISVGVGTAVGVNSLVARRLGEQKKDEADAAASHGLILAVASWFLFFLFGLFFAAPFFGAFTDDAAIRELGISYLSIVCIFSFGQFISVLMEKTLQATGNMIYPMLFQLTGAVINLIFDPLLIFGIGPFPRLGVAGAAIATVAGQIAGMIFSLLVVFGKSHAVHVTLRHFRWRWESVRQIYAVGLPSIVMQSIGSVMVVGMNMILISVEEAAVAVFGVYFKLQSFIFMPVFGLTQGLMPIMGFNFGARNKKRVIGAMRLGMYIAAVIMVLGMLLFLLFPQLLLSFFGVSDYLTSIGVPALRTISLCFPFAALGIVISTLFQAIGLGARSLLMSLTRQLIIILPAAYFLSRIGLSYTWYAFVIAEVVSLLLGIFLYLRCYRSYLAPLDLPAEKEV